jgi:LacI family transcriptional regulator
MPDDPSASRPILSDVARMAGVSIASVSRVLNNVPPISPELRSRVESALRATGYAARRSGNSIQPAVAVLVGDTYNTYFSDILAGIRDQANRNGFLVSVFVNEPDPDFPSRFQRWIIRAPVEGLILCASTGIPEEDLVRIRDLAGLPVVAINRPLKMARIPSIRIDYEAAMAKVIRHVAVFRHRRVAFINGSEGSYSSSAKRAGVEATMAELGLSLANGLYIERAATVEGGFEATNLLFDLPPERRPTAIVASSDLMALGAMHAIRSRGVAIPGDMSVVGFDDIEMAAHANPPLTTISPPKFEMGARAMQFVLSRQTDPSSLADDYRVMESPLIVRESSGPCSEE